MPPNEQLLKEKYTELRIKMKKCKNGSLEKREVKNELKTFIKEVEAVFGKKTVKFLTEKKHG